MDRADLSIFTHLVGDPFLSDERLGREVGLTGKAVRLRRRRMETHGVLTEYGLHPPAEILGRHAVAWGYLGKDRTELRRSCLMDVEDLVYVMSFRPKFHIAVRFTKEPHPAPDPRLARILGEPLDGPLADRPPRPSIPAHRLSRVDWKVLESVVRTPRAPYSARARYAGVSPRTFRLHQSRLGAAHALACVMILDLEREEGLATYGIWLKVDASFDPQAVESLQLWDRPHWTRTPRGVYLLGSGDNYIEAREIELHLQSLPGVLSADPLIPAGGFFARERLVTWIRAERERRWPSRRPAVRPVLIAGGELAGPIGPTRRRPRGEDTTPIRPRARKGLATR
jgi:DNA-binding Lrp family transcriptional regulator